MYLGDLLGVPYKIHGRDKNGYDCYGLAIEVLRRYGYELKDYLYSEANSDTKNEVYSLAINGIEHTELKNPEIGCIVLLEVRGQPFHVGVYIGSGKIIHASIDRGVVIENLVRWENRIKGYYKVNNLIMEKCSNS